MRLNIYVFVALCAFISLSFAWPSVSWADDVLPTVVEMQIHTPLQKVGAGAYRKFGFTIYRATLWAPHGVWDATKPYALQLHYMRSLSQETLANSIIENIQDEKIADDETLARWSVDIKSTMPAVEEGDTMVGVVNPGAETLLYLNGNQIAKIKDEALTQAFFNIWLGESADESLKKSLLGQNE